MSPFDRIVSPIIFFFGVGVCIESIRLSVGTLRHPGPGFLSFLSGIALTLLSVAIFLKSRQEKNLGNFWEAGADKRGILLTVLTLGLYAFLLEELGFLVVSVLFFLVVTRFIAHRSWKLAIALSLCSSGFAYFVFEFCFKLQLPIGVLG